MTLGVLFGSCQEGVASREVSSQGVSRSLHRGSLKAWPRSASPAAQMFSLSHDISLSSLSFAMSQLSLPSRRSHGFGFASADECRIELSQQGCQFHRGSRSRVEQCL